MITEERQKELEVLIRQSKPGEGVACKVGEMEFVQQKMAVKTAVDAATKIEPDPNFPLWAPYKDKKGKLRFDLIPPEMDKAWAEVGTFGIQKLKEKGVQNPERNWERGLKLVEDCLASAKRHINEWEMGLNADKESNLNPLKHALWWLAGMVTLIERGRIDLDDRPNKKEK